MKKLLQPLSLFLSLFAVNAFGLNLPELRPVKGTKYASEWRGTFKITKCIICEDFKLNNGVNLKNLVEFGFDFVTVVENDLPDCAKTDLAVAQYFKITSDDGSNSKWLEKSYGMCDWNPTRSFQILDLSDEFFHYRKQTRNFSNIILQEETFTIDKIEANKYLVHRIVEDPNPSFGLPKKYVYLFEAEKVSPFTASNLILRKDAYKSEEIK